MARLGLIARCDRGGLAAQTWELWRHLKPAKTLVLDVTSSRGPSEPDKYTEEEYGEVRVIHSLPARRDIVWLTSKVDVIWTCETPYAMELCSTAQRRGIPVIVQANPEMYRPHECEGAVLTLPSSWEADRIPEATVLPMPIATEHFTPRQRTSVRSFVHVWGNAFHDRNGTEAVLAALPAITMPCNLIVRGPAKLKLPARVGNVEVVHDRMQHPHYWQGWPEEGDALVMPRRYGGLCLPMNEAAAQGMPIIATNLEPQSDWLPAGALVSTLAGQEQRVKMAGGFFDVHRPDVMQLAATMDRMLRDEALVTYASTVSLQYAAKHSWGSLLPAYERLIESVA